MDKQQAADVLCNHGWLSKTPEAFQNRVIDFCDLQSKPRGQTLYLSGDDAGGILGIAQGHLELHFPVTGEDPTLAYLCAPGMWLGDTAAISGRPRRTTAIVGQRCVLLRLSRADILRIVQADPSAWRHFADLLALNYSKTVNVVDALRRADPVERVATALCNLLGDLPDGDFNVAASQSEIGSMTQLGRTTVNAAMSELQGRGLIRSGYASVEITDAERLRDFVAGIDMPSMAVRLAR